MTISYGNKQNIPKFKLGDTVLKETDSYKYLGFLQNKRNNMKDHFNLMKGKVEAVYQRIIAIARDTTFKNIEMEAIWTNVHSKIESTTTYSGEVWDPNKDKQKN